MKVLLIDVNCKESSTGQIVYNLYSYLNSHGEEAAICYGRGEKVNEKNIYKFGLDWETYLHALLTRVTGFTGCFSFFSTKRLIKFVKRYKPDVVHIHELHAYFVNIKPLINYLKCKQIKTIMTLHCEFAYTGKCGHSLECERWKQECGNCPHLHDYVSTMLFDRTRYMFRTKKKLFDNYEGLTITTPSQWLANRVSQSFLGKYPITVIHNGIDASVFYPRETETLKSKLGIASDKKVVLALAPHLMSEAKGGKDVLKIAKALESENIVFVMVGVDEEDVTSATNVIFSGPIRDKNIISEYYSLADLFVICSKKENYPTTCLEAQSCGTKICGYATGGTSETCLDEANAGFTEYGDIDALCRIISDNQKKTDESSVLISNKARHLFSTERSTSEYLKLYTE